MVWDSREETCLNGVLPISAIEEAKIIKTLLGEIVAHFAIPVSLSVEYSRDEGKPCSGKKLFVVVGFSHARRVGEALANRGEEVINIPVKKTGFEMVSISIEEILSANAAREMIFIFITMDNFSFFGQHPDQSLHLSKSD